MWNWLKRKLFPAKTSITQITIGRVNCHSGALLLADPMLIFDAVRIEGVPPGPVPVVAEIIRYPEGGQRIAMVRLPVRAGEPDSRRVLGEVGVDSATVVALDAQTHEQHWQEVGPDRIGRASLAGEEKKVAELIGKRFGLRHRKADFLHSEFLEPISEELEAEIVAYLKTFPEYARYTFFYFRITTNNTQDRINQAMSDRAWTEVVLNAPSNGNVLAFTSGFGDGRYPVEGLYRGDELIAVEVRFIGPDQDTVLEAFPILRQGSP